MTTTRNRSRAASVLDAHQPDDLNAVGTTVRCTCGEDLPRGSGEALAVHLVHQLDVLELLAADPTEPLSLLALRDVGVGDVVFDYAGRPWMNCGSYDGSEHDVWVAYVDDEVIDELATEDLHAERSPLAMHRPSDPAREGAQATCRVCGCTDDRACEPFGCHWVEPELCSACRDKRGTRS